MAVKKRWRLYKLLFGVITVLVVSILVRRLTWAYSDIKKEPGIDAYAIDDSINRINSIYSKGNSFRFTDKERTTTKPCGIYRIAVLGDSFIWGSGVGYQNAWGHLLEKKLLAKYDSVEVINWGMFSWSTLDEFNFYKQHGKDYNIDLLIIGWVDNDPDIKKYSLIEVIDPAKKYPVVNKIFPALAKRWVNQDEQDEYNIWLNNLYRPENLSGYFDLLTNFHSLLEEQHVSSLFVMTPSPFYDKMKTRFNIIEPIILKANFKCLNLYESSEKKLARYIGVVPLQANPVNGHPGILMTEEFATEVTNYLEENNYLKNLHKK